MKSLLYVCVIVLTIFISIMKQKVQSLSYFLKDTTINHESCVCLDIASFFTRLFHHKLHVKNDKRPIKAHNCNQLCIGRLVKVKLIARIWYAHYDK